MDEREQIVDALSSLLGRQLHSFGHAY